jgi:transposase-like protein
MAGKRCGLDFKAQILKESFSPGVVLVDLARSYGIRPDLLYGWRSVVKNVNHQIAAHKPTLAAKCASALGNFVELRPSLDVSVGKITMASISFRSSQLSIDGEISAACLSQLIGIMGAEC